jgi:hypothetical protein
MVSFTSPRRLIRLTAVIALACPAIARADLGVVVADPTNLGASRFTIAGHSLLYLSGVCAETPIRARLCAPGEQGSIVTMYPDFHEAQPYAWNLVPFSLYLHGSLTPGARLLYASTFVKQSLELHAREGILQPVCAGDHCPLLPHSYWRDTVAITADRDIFLYAVHTTPAQDQLAVDWLNRDPNRNHYNPITNNCADFTSSLVNAIFPHSVHRDLLNDVGLMGPKAAARSFTRWALQRPELGFYAMHFAQQPGDIPRSGLARSGTETVIHMKKYLIPTIVLGDFELSTSIFAAYIFTGRFGLYKEFSHHPSPTIVTLESNERSAKADGNQTLQSSLHAASEQERANILGTPQEWAAYRERFAAIQSSIEVQNLSPDHKHPFLRQYASATALVDKQGHPWLTFGDGPSPRRVGISSANLLSSESDPELAFQLMLGRIAYTLKAKNHMQETMQEFRQDWALLEQTRSRVQSLPIATAPPPPATSEASPADRP